LQSVICNLWLDSKPDEFFCALRNQIKMWLWTRQILCVFFVLAGIQYLDKCCVYVHIWHVYIHVYLKGKVFTTLKFMSN